MFLADHASHELFVSIRGTDKDMRRATLARDLGNDALIFFGFMPVRVRTIAAEYRAVCKTLPGYTAYGTGHSLGASIVEYLAIWAEKRPRITSFARVDLFNPGSSPFQGAADVRISVTPLRRRTNMHSHRVQGDVVSKFHVPRGQDHIYPRRAHMSAHVLGQFLPLTDAGGVSVKRIAPHTVPKAVAHVNAMQAAARDIVICAVTKALFVVVEANEAQAVANALAAADAAECPTSRKELALRARLIGPVARQSRQILPQEQLTE